MCIFQAQIRITDLVVDKLRIADTSIATLSENIVQGVSPGRTEIQVRITRKQTIRSLLLSYPKNYWRARAPPILFEPTCAHARWALMRRLPSVCD